MGVIVRQKVKGRGKPWWVFIAHQGKRKSIKVGEWAAATALAAKIQGKLKAGELQLSPEKKIPNFGDYAEKWLAGYGETHLKYSTWKGYKGILKNHLKALMDRPLDQLNRAELKDLIYLKTKGRLSDGHGDPD